MSWDKPVDRLIVRQEILQEMEQQVAKIKQNLKASQDKQTNYADRDRQSTQRVPSWGKKI